MKSTQRSAEIITCHWVSNQYLSQKKISDQTAEFMTPGTNQLQQTLIISLLGQVNHKSTEQSSGKHELPYLDVKMS